MFGSSRKTVSGPRGEELPEPNEGLPDSSTPSGLCPRCGKQSSFDVIGSLPVTFDLTMFAMRPDGAKEPLVSDRVSSLICRHCHQGVVVVEEELIGGTPRREGGHSGAVSQRGFHWWPLPEAKQSPDVPPEIASAFAEAATALAANCPRASAVMARRTLEAITIDQGVTTGTLYERLKTLASSGTLLATLADWSKEVRLIGNVGAHFDPIVTVSLDDARHLVAFVQELLRYLYELPAELNQRRGTS